MTFPLLDDTATKHLAVLNGNVYVVGGLGTPDIQEQPAAEFAVTVAQGPPSQDTRENLSYWTMANWTPGLGKKFGDFREDQGRFWNSTWDTRIAGQLILPPLVNTHGTAQSVSAAGEDAHFVFFKNMLYVAYSDKVFRYTAGAWAEVLDVGTGIISGMTTFLSSSGTHRIYVFVNSDRFWYSTTGASAAWTQSDASVIAYSGLPYQGHLILFGGDTNEGEISWSTATDADGAAASYTTLTQVPATAASHIRGVIFRDPDGEQVPYFALLDLQGECAIFTLHPYRLTADTIDVSFLREDTYYSGQPGLIGLVRWQDKLYIPTRQTVLEYEPGSARDIGPLANSGQGLPAGMDHIGGLLAGRDYLFGVVGQTTVRIVTYTGIGWHFMATPSVAVAGMYMDGVSGRARLYWAEVATTTLTVKYIDYAEQVNPVNQSGYAYNDTGDHTTPWMNLGFDDLDKILLRMRIRAENLSDLTANPATGAEVRIDYQLNDVGADGSGWTVLGIFEEETDILRFGASSQGVVCRSVRFRIVGTRGTTNTVTPIVRALTLDYLVTPDYRGAISFWIDIGGTIRHRGEPYTDINTVMQELHDAFEADTLVTYQWGEDNPAAVTPLRVKVVSYKTSMWDLPVPDPVSGSPRDGISQVQILEPMAHAH